MAPLVFLSPACDHLFLCLTLRNLYNLHILNYKEPCAFFPLFFLFTTMASMRLFFIRFFFFIRPFGVSSALPPPPTLLFNGSLPAFLSPPNKTMRHLSSHVTSLFSLHSPPYSPLSATTCMLFFLQSSFSNSVSPPPLHCLPSSIASL